MHIADFVLTYVLTYEREAAIAISNLVLATPPTTPPAGMADATPYSIGLVVVCVVLLLLLWLPDVLRKD